MNNYQQIKNLNLPKLDRIIVKNSSPYKGGRNVLRQPSEKNSIEISNILKIEGKGNQYGGPIHKSHSRNPDNIRYDYDYELSKKAAERDIKAELRKIYNLRPSPKKVMKRNVELPRIK